MAESSRLPEVGEVTPTNLSVISFQDASSARPKLSVALFKDLGLISGSAYTMSKLQTSLLPCMTAIKTGKMKIAGNVKDSAFIYNGLHFPQMKLASGKPPEAFLEGVIFSWAACPQTPQSTPSLIPYGNLAGQVFSCFLWPCLVCVWVHEQSVNHISLKKGRPRCYVKSPTASSATLE